MLSNKPRETTSLGQLAEGVAAKYLLERNYIIVEHNFALKFAEIDIIASRDGTMHFIEVKSLRANSGASFSPELRVNSRKFSKISKLASLYMEQYASLDSPWQIDIVAITFDFPNRSANIKHFKNISSNFL